MKKLFAAFFCVTLAVAQQSVPTMTTSQVGIACNAGMPQVVLTAGIPAFCNGTVYVSLATMLSPAVTKFSQNISSGSLASQTVFTDATSAGGLYRVSFYLAPTTSNAIAVVTGTFSWTDGGVVKSGALSGLALIALSNYVQGSLVLSVDPGTEVTFSDTVTGTSGAYVVRVIVTQIGSGT